MNKRCIVISPLLLVLLYWPNIKSMEKALPPKERYKMMVKKTIKKEHKGIACLKEKFSSCLKAKDSKGLQEILNQISSSKHNALMPLLERLNPYLLNDQQRENTFGKECNKLLTTHFYARKLDERLMIELSEFIQNT